MRIDTQSFVVLRQVKRAKLCFVMKHIEIFVELEIVDKLCPYFFFAVSERAKLPVLTLLYVVWIVRTELFFICLILI